MSASGFVLSEADGPMIVSLSGFIFIPLRENPEIIIYTYFNKKCKKIINLKVVEG